MHQIDLGVIISFMKAILRKYLECVEIHLNIPGRAAKKLTERLQKMLKKKKQRQDIQCQVKMIV